MEPGAWAGEAPKILTVIILIPWIFACSVIVTILLQYITERVVENLVRHLLAVLDRPEKLLLLREIRYTERQQQ